MKNERSIVVDHDSIPGFMMPMVMPFNVINIDAVKELVLMIASILNLQ